MAVTEAPNPLASATESRKVRAVHYRSSTVRWLVVVMVVLFGVVERWLLLRHSNLQPDSDESLAGLMGLDLLRGHARPFLWGQPYGGTPEIVPVAIAIKLFGASLFSLRITTILLGAIAPVLLWRIARRLMSPTGAVAAALTLWIWPTACLSWSMREYLYYTPAMVAGLVAMLLAQRSMEEQRRWFAPLGLGLALGAGWWMTPYIAYFGLFVVLVIWRAWRWMLRRGWLAVIGFGIGASPWLIYNLVLHHFLSLATPAGATRGSYESHLLVFLHDGVPVVLGLKGWYTRYWLGASQLGELRWLAMLLGALMVLAFVAVISVTLWRWIRHKGRFPVDMVCLAAWPFLYAFSPMTGSKTLFIPRYFFFIWPYLALLAGRLIQSRKVLPFGMAIVVVLASFGVRDQNLRVNDWPYTGELRKAAAANGVNRMFSSYWVAYRIMYETREKIIATPAFALSVRNGRYNDIVRSSPHPAWVFRRGDNREVRFVAATHRMGMDLHPIRAGAYDLYLLDRLLLPEQLPQDVSFDPAEGV